ncbi:peptidyl-alpha-hydroxyglycine alpha-amidating lyase family protein [Longirhabdus pacifica]|uniref:peptidyl-alpha-hydroxyglycine alpha-amidating lyase family protein n=1 Tax=Longirhabdus pacifica TaxID=2305227 RepID=UPI00100937F2|nr:peptidyl-alpha-hydroxyglycine alpha-amidating lyase family protein [Longirhabdus pacifica]
MKWTIKTKTKVTILIVLCLTLLLVYFKVGGAAIVYKDLPVSISIEESGDYEPSILWPLTEEDQQIAGQAAGVAVNQDGDIYYLHRGSNEYGGEALITQPTVIVFDSITKQVKAEWGENVFQSPHGIEIDEENNVWITDTAQNKVYTFTADGELISSYGEDYPFYMETALRVRNELPNFPTGIKENMFARPTDVTVNEDGSFIVSDGYRNSRIVKFDAEGNFLWEKNELGDEIEEFHLPHGISQDQSGNIYVADRNNARIQVLDDSGNAIASWDENDLGRPFSVEVASNGLVYVGDGGDALYPNEQQSSQIVVLDSNGSIIERFGKWGENVGEFKIPHDIAVDDSGNIYVADLNNHRIQMLTYQAQ